MKTSSYKYYETSLWKSICKLDSREIFMECEQVTDKTEEKENKKRKRKKGDQ